MRRLLFVLFCLSIGLALAGCGGSGSSASNPLAGSALVGRWVGTFTANNGQTGPIYLNIQTSGTLTGTGVNTVTNGSFNAGGAQLAGIISTTGLTSITQAGVGSSTVLSGTLSVNGSSQLTGTLTSTSGLSITMTLTSIPSGSNTFSGALNGTFAVPAGDSGTLSMVVDASGNVVGVADDTTSSNINTFTGTVTNAGGLSLTQNNGETVTGMLNLSGTTATGLLTVKSGTTTVGTTNVTLTHS